MTHDTEFDAIVAGLEGELDFSPTDVVSVAILDDVTLSSRFTAVRQELLKLGEMISPTTETGRRLHSERAAYLVEMRKRGMK